MRFSEKYGFKPVKEQLQINSMDDDLRNSLWNALKICYWDSIEKRVGQPSVMRTDSIKRTEYKVFFQNLFMDFFISPIDDHNFGWSRLLREIREYFFKFDWCTIYDFIQFFVQRFPSSIINNEFIKLCNRFLEREVSAYRFIGNEITPITDKTEIQSIEESLQVEIDPVREHLNQALKLLSDRKEPDYRNSIKESISAIEALVRKITGEKGKFPNLLNSLEKKIELHPALKEAFDKLYGYTSDKGGIRHSLLEKSEITFEDAKFMLVTCSAFANYVVSIINK